MNPTHQKLKRTLKIMAQSHLDDDALICQEEYFSDNNNGDDEIYTNNGTGCNNSVDDGATPVAQILVYEQDLYWDDDELTGLLSKEKEFSKVISEVADPYLCMARKEAVDWILKVRSHYSFSGQTALLAVNYFDRFMFRFEFQKDKQWMSQLAALACLSLAAKVEETNVPLLLEFQIEDSKYVFEAKTIQRMEILVLSTLEWKMNSVTPCSFLDYLRRRIPLKDLLCLDFLKRCERILLATICDSRFNGYLPSTLAAATFLHVIMCFEPYIGDQYQNQLFDVLGIDKQGKIEECCQLIYELAAESLYRKSLKRKSVSRPGSPNGVIDVSFSTDCSNDSWAVASVTSSPEPLAKKLRTAEDHHLERCNHPPVDFLSFRP